MTASTGQPQTPLGKAAVVNDSVSREQDPALLSASWGALWGPALGAWFLAPALIEMHHFHPENWQQWIVLVGGLAALFAIVGTLIAVIAGLPLVIVEQVRGPFRLRSWAYGLFIGVLLIGAYAIDSLAVHWVAFAAQGLSSPVLQHEFFQFAKAFLVGWLLAGTMYHVALRQRPRPSIAILRWVLMSAAVAGLVALVVRTPPRDLLASREGSLIPVRSQGRDVPLLFVGIDGATWRLLQPAIETGAAPTLRSLVDAGMHGKVDALWPPYWSGASWAAILTGFPRERTGVYEDIAGSGPGLPIFQVPLSTQVQLNPLYPVRAMLRSAGIIRFTPPPRDLLGAKPIWQLLHEAQIDTAVVRFRFTYPPAGQAGVVVSDWVGEDQWEGMGVRREMLPDVVSPAQRREELLSPFTSAASSTPNLFARLLPEPPSEGPADARRDPIAELRLAANIDDRTFDATETILKSNPVQPFMAVYIGGLDSIEHAFWQYRFPDDFPTDRPAAGDIQRLGAVPDRYVHYLDERLRRLLALYQTPPNVVIVSDHGHGAATFPSVWRGWHTSEGVFVAAGPSVPHETASIAVSYFDVVPTLAYLKGFAAPPEIRGRSRIPPQGGQEASMSGSRQNARTN